jgi:hypothetical protein
MPHKRFVSTDTKKDSTSFCAWKTLIGENEDKKHLLLIAFWLLQMADFYFWLSEENYF